MMTPKERQDMIDFVTGKMEEMKDEDLFDLWWFVKFEVGE